MKLFLKWFGTTWLFLTLPAVIMAIAQAEIKPAYIPLFLITLAPGVWGLVRSRAYPERDEFSAEIVEGSVLGGLRRILRDPRKVWKSLQW